MPIVALSYLTIGISDSLSSIVMNVGLRGNGIGTLAKTATSVMNYLSGGETTLRKSDGSKESHLLLDLQPLGA